MTAVKGEKPEAVARQLNVSVGSVYAAKFRIVKRIRSLVSKMDDHEFDDSILNVSDSKQLKPTE